MKTLFDCVVDSIIKDLQSQIRADRTVETVIAEPVRISFSACTEITMQYTNNKWAAEVIVKSIGGVTVAENVADVTIVGENKKYVPHWGRIREAIRDTIAAYVRY